jgi:ubiquitin-protein ligase
VAEDLFHWQAVIIGPEGSPYAVGLLLDLPLHLSPWCDPIAMAGRRL